MALDATVISADGPPSRGLVPGVAGPTATLDELASACVFLMPSNFVTGQQLAVDGGIMLGA
jgi:NAD(P)-dependent dehydrogenase (short-subunit alcohol dehydrogenase family)